MGAARPWLASLSREANASNIVRMGFKVWDMLPKVRVAKGEVSHELNSRSPYPVM